VPEPLFPGPVRLPLNHRFIRSVTWRDGRTLSDVEQSVSSWDLAGMGSSRLAVVWLPVTKNALVYLNHFDLCA